MCDPHTSKVDSKSAAIEKILREEAKKVRSKVKILLLGTGSAGKSTFLKQLKVLNTGGFSEAENVTYVHILRENALETIQVMCRVFQDDTYAGTPLPKELASDSKLVLESEVLTPEVAEATLSLMDSMAMKEVFSNATRLNLHLSSAAPYYLKHIKDYAKADYHASNEDIMQARIKTTSVSELVFEQNSREFTVVDVGGQRTERRKWLHCFESVTCVIYLAALDEYDMVLEEDHKTNRLTESLKLFHEITGSQWLSAKSWMLFLNKSDLFKDKIKKFPLHKYFKDCPKEDGSNFGKASTYIQNLYENEFAGTGNSKLYPYITCVVDADNAKNVFISVRDILISSSLSDNGMM